MNRFRFLLIIAVVFAFIMAACEKEPLEERLQQDQMIINNNLSQLGQRVSIIDGGRLLPVIDVDGEESLKGLKQETVQSKYEIYLRAEVNPPSHEGKTLQASHIKIVGDNAWVTYNRQGPEYLGGVDVFDISDIDNPGLIQSVIFPYKDISSLDIDLVGQDQERFIFLTGAVNPLYDEHELNSSALVERYIANEANSFKHLDETPQQHYDLPGFAGNDVRYNQTGNQAVYVTSGSDGGLTILNNGMQNPQKPEDSQETEIPFARSIDTDGEDMVVYSAENNRLIIMDMDGNYVSEIETGGDHFYEYDVEEKYLEAKSIVRLKDKLAFVAAGTGGMEVYDIKSGNKVGWIDRPAIPEDADDPLDYVTNGVSVDENYILAANGGAGVNIAELDDTGENRVRSIGKFMFESGSSANFVEAQGNKVFVATGKGGLKILEIVELEPTEPCVTLWDKIVELFPERESIHGEEHPAHELSMEGLPGTIELLEEGPVYITFIHNGAGWDNRFGYYAYHRDEVPESAGDLDKQIIYSYVNENSNGEPREQGERVRLGTDDKIFPAGTIIGFYILADGWDPENNQAVDPRHTVYTTPEFNEDGVRKHVLFLEESCLDIVLGFEDMLDGSDEDFNDIIFTISNGDDVWGNEHNYFIDIENLPVK